MLRLLGWGLRGRACTLTKENSCWNSLRTRNAGQWLARSVASSPSSTARMLPQCALSWLVAASGAPAVCSEAKSQGTAFPRRHSSAVKVSARDRGSKALLALLTQSRSSVLLRHDQKGQGYTQ